VTATGRSAGRATDREIAVVIAVLDAGSEKEAAHRLGLSHSTVKHHLASARSKVGATTTAQLVWILAPRLPEPEGRRSRTRRLTREVRRPARGYRTASMEDREVHWSPSRSRAAAPGSESLSG
jgi:DNA-binding CsgD family transcriptional regulator